jgi:hypothetical protein
MRSGKTNLGPSSGGEQPLALALVFRGYPAAGRQSWIIASISYDTDG